MSRTIKAICVLLGLFCVMGSLTKELSTNDNVAAKDVEMKAVWSATVFSLDYPQVPTNDSKVLQRNLDEMLQNVQELGFNTIFFQVRPSSDAFYKSDIFPWSKYLTGTQGLAPLNNFDPLEYLIAQAHAKGISIHAWINPYRVIATENDKNSLSPDSIPQKYPELIVEHNNGKLYLNPGEPMSNKLIIDGVLEIIRNYDVDGIHIDDYFYPDSSFKDSETFAKYGGSFSDIGDWRRNNTYSLISGIHNAINKEKPNVMFSLSPCGIWANKESHPLGSDSKGVQSYYDYYADTRLWVKDEIVDCILPQIYWNTGNAVADFEKLARWWNDVVDGTNVKLCIGQAAYRVSEETNPSSVWYGQSGLDELEHQASLLQSLKNVSGRAYYRLGCILDNELLSSHTTDLNSRVPMLFYDMKDCLWAKDAIEALYSKGIVNGMGDGSFGCFSPVTRADSTLMLTRMMNKTTTFTENFSDVTADKYYYNEIGVAKALGYAAGRGDNLFDPQGNITRQDMAVMAYRVLKAEGKINFKGNSSLSAKFTDSHNIAEYAIEAVSAMTENNYLSGYDTGEFKPLSNATRAETAVFLYKILSK